MDVFFRRFRPTSIADTALLTNLDEAQKRAGHAKPAQTFSYAVNPTTEARLRESARNAQSKALTSVRTSYSQRPPERDVAAMVAQTGVTPGAANEILMGKRDKLFNACSDDLNGKGPVREGTRCGKYESCLVCANSVILPRHLPRLIAYQNDWFSKADQMTVEEWDDAYGLNCTIVDVHLKKFDEEVVREARLKAESLAANLPCFRFRRA